jgi:hypothetical protein
MGVSTGMIFIRNQNGSHNPDEHMDFADFCCAADVLTKWVKNSLANLQTWPKQPLYRRWDHWGKRRDVPD